LSTFADELTDATDEPTPETTFTTSALDWVVNTADALASMTLVTLALEDVAAVALPANAMLFVIEADPDV